MIKYFNVILVTVLLVVVIGLLVSFPIMLLWNYCLVPAVSIASEITWLQAWGLLILFHALFKSSTYVKK